VFDPSLIIDPIDTIPLTVRRQGHKLPELGPKFFLYLFSFISRIQNAPLFSSKLSKKNKHIAPCNVLNINKATMDKKKSLLLLSAAAIGTFLYKALKPIKSDIKGVSNFNINAYLGTWYEIARMDFRWEKNLKNVTANYSSLADGTIQVTNSGYDAKKEKVKTSIGKATFMREHTEGALKVSFFKPFSAGYYVMKIDKDYRYALVFGDNLDYMWILSREKSLPGDIKADYLDYALRSGFEIHKLVWTTQD